MVLGASGTTKPRTIVAIPEKKFAEVIDEWRINDQEPSPVLLASAGLIGTVARLACGVVKPAAQREAEIENNKKIDVDRLNLQVAVGEAAGRCRRERPSS